MRPNQSMKPTAPWQSNFSVLAADPARGLSVLVKLISGSADTTRSCDRRSLRGAKACGDAGKLRLVSTFDESTNFWADRRDLCREFQAIFSRQILSHGKSLRVPSGLICLFASMAEPLPATKFRPPSSCRFPKNHSAKAERP